MLGSGLPTMVNNLTLAAGMTNSVNVTNSPGSVTPNYTVNGTLTANNAVIAYTVLGNQLKRGSYPLFTYGSLSGSFNPVPQLISGSVDATPTIVAGSGSISLVVPDSAPVAAPMTAYRTAGLSLKIHCRT